MSHHIYNEDNNIGSIACPRHNDVIAGIFISSWRRGGDDGVLQAHVVHWPFHVEIAVK